MEQQNYTLEQAAEKFGKPHKIFDIQIGDRLYPVYSIEGYEHNLGKWNGCPDTWWLDYSVYHSDNDDEVPTMRELIPYIDTGVHRVCWEVNYRQFNSTKYKWDEWSIRNGGICTIKANGKEVYKFHWIDLGGALAEAHSLISKISEHPFNFINPKEEIGRKIWYYGLPATILLGYEPGEIRINPDLSYMTSDDWWNELEKRKLNIEPPNPNQTEDDLLDAEHFAEHKDYGSINHGSVFYDGMINWFRREKKYMNNEKMNEIPPAIEIAVDFMKRSFGGTEVEIVSEAYRQNPSEYAPAGALGCDVHISIPDHEMKPVKLFLANSIAEDIAFNNMGGAPDLAQMIADEIVFMSIKPEYEKLKNKIRL